MRLTKKIIFTFICMIISIYSANAKVILSFEGEKYIEGNDDISFYIVFKETDSTKSLPAFSDLYTGVISHDSKIESITCSGVANKYNYYDTTFGTSLVLSLPGMGGTLTAYPSNVKRIRIAECTLKQSSDFKVGDTSTITINAIGGEKEGNYVVGGVAKYFVDEIEDNPTWTIRKYADSETIGKTSIDGASAGQKLITTDYGFSVTYEISLYSNKYIQRILVPLIYDRSKLNLLSNIEIDNNTITKGSTTVKKYAVGSNDLILIEYMASDEITLLKDNKMIVTLYFEQIDFSEGESSILRIGNGEVITLDSPTDNSGSTGFIAGSQITLIKSTTPSSITLNKYSLELYKNKNVNNTITYTKTGLASSENITWSVPSGLTYEDNGSGKLTIKTTSDTAIGSYEITGTAAGITTNKLTVTVNNPICYLTNISNMYVGESKNIELTSNPTLTDSEKNNVVLEITKGNDLIDIEYPSKTDKSNIKITAKKAGEVSLSVKTSDNVCIKTMSFVINTSSIDLYGVSSVFVNETSKISYTITPTTSTATIASWHSKDESKVTVDEHGNVTGKAITTSPVEVCAKLTDGAEGCVNISVYTKKVTITSTLSTLEKGQSASLTATTTPSGETVTWTSSNNELATITQSGNTATIKAIKSGTVTITAKISDKIYTTKEIIITEPASLSIDQADTTKYIGDTLTVTATTNSTGIKKWSSSNSTIASITNNGNTATITTNQAGTTIITVEDNNGKTASFTLNVKEKSLKLSINNTDIEKGNTKKITVIKTGIDDLKEIEWTVEDESIISLENTKSTSLTNTITAKSIGTTKITATSDGYSNNITIRVVSNESSSGGTSSDEESSSNSDDSNDNNDISSTTDEIVIVINPSEKQVIVGEAFSLYASTNMTSSDVKWSFDNENIIKYEVADNRELKITAIAAGTVTVTATIGDKSTTSKIIISATDQNAANDETIVVKDNDNPHTGITIPSMMVTNLSFGLIAARRKERKTKKVYKI